MQRRALKELESRQFDMVEFEVFVDFLQAHREDRILEEQRRGAGKLGVNHKELFLEFRRELTILRDCFLHFDEVKCGRLDENETWAALNSLGLVPTCWDQKRAFLKFVAEACWKNSGESKAEQTLAKKQARGPRRLCIGTLLMSSQGGPSEGDMLLGTVEFEDFLEIMSKIRTWLQQSMREELQALFDRCLRRRGTSSHSENPVLGIPEVCMALEDLKMAPTCAKEQMQVSRLLEDANEWGFEPLTLDFEGFVRFIRRIREWRASMQRRNERAFAVREMMFSEQSCDEHRVAFDVLDKDAIGELDITGVRKIFLRLKFNISSEQLRFHFAKVDRRQIGFIRFLEYLNLVFDYETLQHRQMNRDDMFSGIDRNALAQRLSNALDRAMDNKLLFQAAEPCVAFEE